MKLLKRASAGLAALAVAASIAVAPAAAQPDPLAPAITWEECPETVNIDRAECGRIDVPREYSNPTGPTISVGFVRVPAADPAAKRGTLFGNPGGPGGDAIAYFGNDAVPFPDALRNEWDMVAVQPRGLVGSTPLNCAEPDPNSQHDPILTPGGFFRDSCDHQNPGLPRSLTTSNTAEDWEMVRRSLGLETISILGLSYGTYLGSVYATRYPDRVDKLVLDSAMDPSLAWNGVVGTQAQGFENALYEFLGFVADHNHLYGLGTTPLQVYQAWTRKIIAESGTNPTTVPPPARIGDLPAGFEWAGQAGADLMTATGAVRVEGEGIVSRAVNPGASQANSYTMLMTQQLLPAPMYWDGLARHLNGTVPYNVQAEIDYLESLSEEELAEFIFAAVASQGTLTNVTCNENIIAPDYTSLLPYFWGTYASGDFMANYTDGFKSGMACRGITPVRGKEHLDGSQLKTRPLQISGTTDPQTVYHRRHYLANAMGATVVTVHGPGHGHFANHNPVVDDIVIEYLRTGNVTTTDAPGFDILGAAQPLPDYAELENSPGLTRLGVTR